MRTRLMCGIICTVMFPFVMVQCSIEEAQEKDQASDGKTVTIKVSSNDLIRSKTALGDDFSVQWQEGDYISICSGEYLKSYQVIPNTDDPTVGTVENVTSGDEYFAGYLASVPISSPNQDYYTIYFNSSTYYKQNSFTSNDNPMIAYARGEEPILEFKNMSGIIRLGITGDHPVFSVTITANDNLPISGAFQVPKEDIMNNNLADTYDNSGSGSSSKIMFPDDYETGIPVSKEEPVYLYFTVPPRVYSGGITVTVGDMEGNVAVKRTDNEINALRSTIAPMATFDYNQEIISKLAISEVSQTSSSVSWTVKAEPGMKIMTGLIYKDVYDGLSTAIEKKGYAVSTLYRNCEGGSLSPDASGLYQTSSNKVLNFDGELVPVSANTEYYIVAGYAIESEFIGGETLMEASTPEGTGAAPELEVSINENKPYLDVSLNIKASDNTKDIRVYMDIESEYEELVSKGLSDSDIARSYGSALDSLDVTTSATETGCNYNPRSLLWDSFRYKVIVSATSEGGIDSTKDLFYESPAFEPDSLQWETVCEESKIDIDRSVSYVGGKIERTVGEDIFRIYLKLDENPEPAEFIENKLSVTANDEQSCIYIHLKKNEWGTYHAFSITGKSRLGFSSPDGAPLAFLDYPQPAEPSFYTSNGNTVNFGLNAQPYNVNGDIAEEYGHNTLNISVLGEISPKSPSMGLEGFEIEDTHSWK